MSTLRGNWLVTTSFEHLGVVISHLWFKRSNSITMLVSKGSSSPTSPEPIIIIIFLLPLLIFYFRSEIFKFLLSVLFSCLLFKLLTISLHSKGFTIRALRGLRPFKRVIWVLKSWSLWSPTTRLSRISSSSIGRVWCTKSRFKSRVFHYLFSRFVMCNCI